MTSGLSPTSSRRGLLLALATGLVALGVLVGFAAQPLRSASPLAPAAIVVRGPVLQPTGPSAPASSPGADESPRLTVVQPLRPVVGEPDDSPEPEANAPDD